MEVTKLNFRDILPDLKEAINTCDFVCIDTEFTGLNISVAETNNLFDGATERYAKQRKSVQNFTLTQVGLTCFTKDKIYNKYEVAAFNIYVFPRSFDLSNNVFSCQVTALDFLRKNNFNFNKFIYEGVPFLNHSQAQVLCSQIEQGFLDENLIDEEFIQNAAEKIVHWQNKNENVLELEIKSTESDLVTKYLIAYQLIKLFPYLKIDYTSCFCTFKLTKTNTEKWFDNVEKAKFFHLLLFELMGCAIVFDLLVKSRKPLLGQNMFFDLLYMYEKFYQPLPENYLTFKQNVHEMFPILVDTKQIAIGMKQILTDCGCKSFSLSGLYEVLECKNEVKFQTHYQPHVELSESSRKYAGDDGQQYFHEAGYDAFIVGIVFLRMAHIYAHLNVPSTAARTLSFAEHLAAVKVWVNRINLIKAALPYADFAGNDPFVNRPQWLTVTPRRYGTSIDTLHLSRKLSSFGYLDMRSVSKKSALIAVATFDGAKLILDKFKNDSQYKVQRYSVLKHTKAGKIVVWSGTMLAVAASIFVITKISFRGWLMTKS